MHVRTNDNLHHTRGILRIFTALIFVLAAARSALATDQPKYAYLDYNTYYYYGSGGYNHFSTVVNGSTPDGFWQSAEEIELAEDAYNWASVNDTGDMAAYKTEILDLVNGFRQHNGDDWSADKFNDDLDVAIIAFARCYQISGASICLTDAEHNIGVVWDRAQQGNGGLCENSSGTLGCYENSSVNWTFVIGAKILKQITGNTAYDTDAIGVYNWAKANLTQTSGEIDDAPGVGVTGQYSYNYGYAFGAAFYEDDYGSWVTTSLTYLMTNLNNPNFPYDGTYNSYNILPNYGQGQHDNDGGFNGITMRWIGAINTHGLVTSTQLAWAQANVTDAWNHRNSSGLSWDHWNATTPANVNGGQPYSWDCSSTVVGMFDIPGM